MNESLLFLIPLMPLLCGVLNTLFGMRLPRLLSEALAVFGVLFAAVLTSLFWFRAEGSGTSSTLYTWMAAGDLKVPLTILFDHLSATMALMVTWVSTLIHLYAVGYMHEEEDYARFFALLNLFVFAMLTIVLADNLLLLFLGWEGVGFCSYGLIGYWYRKGENADAGRKAFLVTRVGDVFFAVAMLWLFSLFGTLSLSGINAQATTLAPATLTALTLLLLGGACGKSAQLPLMTWLPDAMAGPTPVSALIHAATMVTAGVYLLCRLFPLVSLSPFGMAAIATVGAATALYAATCALAQREIKKVLAYSTMSQIGYMFLAVGAGSVTGAMFHLFTHAFFKALLFMGAGCVIHLCGGENDIHRMGGLARKAPYLFACFLAGALCLAGVPLTGGFFSKDMILLATFTQGGLYYRVLWGVGAFTALLTAVYTFRLVYLVFGGSPRVERHDHPLPGVMLWTLLPLALLGLGGGLFDLPGLYGGKELLGQLYATGGGRELAAGHGLELKLAGLAALLVLCGWLLAHWRYRRYGEELPGAKSRFLLRGWQADAAVEAVLLRPFRSLALFFWQGGDGALIDGFLDGLARGCYGVGGRLRLITSGRLSTYLQALAWGLLLMLGWLLLVMVSRGGA